MKFLMTIGLAAGLLTTPVFSSEKPFSKNRLILKLKEGSSVPNLKGIKKVKNLFGQMYVVYTNDVLELEKKLNENSSVEYVELDYIADQKNLAEKVKTIEPDSKQVSETPFNDPKVDKVWSFRDSSRHGVSVNKAYVDMRKFTKSEIIVAVVDTGVDFNHPDLKDNMWTNPGEIPGNGIDDDNNGYIDDIHGINTLIRDSEGNATVDMMDAHGHGTHVSGTIGAVQNNNLGIAGIAEKVKIMGIRTVPNSSDEKDVDVIEAFIYAAKNGAKIINCSFGKSHNEGGMAVSETIDHIAQEYGVLVVAAAGNSSQNIDRRLTYPASFENNGLLVVASTSSWGNMSYFSNYGAKNVDVAAPGSNIYSLAPGGGYQSMSGTSMASPTTAGVAAEVLSNYPHLGPVELKELLMSSVTKLGRFTSKMVSGGRVDLAAALTNAYLFY